MVEMLTANRHRFKAGVVHSFDGEADEAAALVALDLYIGTLALMAFAGESSVTKARLYRLRVFGDERGCFVGAGINGCSLKTARNLEVVATIPAERLMLETDCPWCEIRPSHAGFAAVATRWPSVKKERWEPGCRVKSRVEPEHIWQVLEVVAHARGEDKVSLHAYACVGASCAFRVSPACHARRWSLRGRCWPTPAACSFPTRRGELKPATCMEHNLSHKSYTHNHTGTVRHHLYIAPKHTTKELHGNEKCLRSFSLQYLDTHGRSRFLAVDCRIGRPLTYFTRGTAWQGTATCRCGTNTWESRTMAVSLVYS